MKCPALSAGGRCKILPAAESFEVLAVDVLGLYEKVQAVAAKEARAAGKWLQDATTIELWAGGDSRATEHAELTVTL